MKSLTSAAIILASLFSASASALTNYQLDSIVKFSQACESIMLKQYEVDAAQNFNRNAIKALNGITDNVSNGQKHERYILDMSNPEVVKQVHEYCEQQSGIKVKVK